jgi:hypothetical protein
MKSKRHALLPLSLLVLAGCASTTPTPDARPLKIEPVQRVQQPAGTAAGQYAVGRMDLAADRYESAVRRFELAIQLDPRMLEAHNALGVAHGRAGNFGMAVASFEAALAMAPDAPHVLNNLGFAQMKAGRLEESWRSLKRALQVDPRNATTRENVRLLALVFERPVEEEAVEVVAARGPERANPAVAARAAAAVPSSSHEIVSAVTNDGRLVRIAPAVYEIRSHAVAAASVPAGLPRVPDVGAPTAPPTVDRPLPSRGAVETMPPRELEAKETALPSPPATPLSETPPDRSIAVRAAIVEVEGLEVSNAVGTPHVARGMARGLARLGIDTVRVSDYRVFNKPHSEIHYRDGYRGGAQALLSTLPVHAKAIRSATLRPGVNVRLVVGRDLASRSVAGWPDRDVDVAGSPEAQPSRVGGRVDLSRFASIVKRADVEEGWREG